MKCRLTSRTYLWHSPLTITGYFYLVFFRKEGRQVDVSSRNNVTNLHCVASDTSHSSNEFFFQDVLEALGVGYLTSSADKMYEEHVSISLVDVSCLIITWNTLCPAAGQRGCLIICLFELHHRFLVAYRETRHRIDKTKVTRLKTVTTLNCVAEHIMASVSMNATFFFHRSRRGESGSRINNKPVRTHLQ